jgi:starch phosphorylase
MRESMAQLTPRFSADRTVRDYTEQHYLPAASAYLARAASKGYRGKQIADLLHALDQKWGSLHFGELKFESIDQYNKIEVQIYFGDLDPDTLQVELFANAIDGKGPLAQKMTRGAKIEGADNAFHFNASVTSGRPATDYTPRVIPNLPGVSVPLETNLILWQH